MYGLWDHFSQRSLTVSSRRQPAVSITLTTSNTEDQILHPPVTLESSMPTAGEEVLVGLQNMWVPCRMAMHAGWEEGGPQFGVHGYTKCNQVLRAGSLGDRTILYLHCDGYGS